jgi:tetrahydromethanopterin S-methyltransferase subunit G
MIDDAQILSHFKEDAKTFDMIQETLKSIENKVDVTIQKVEVFTSSTLPHIERRLERQDVVASEHTKILSDQSRWQAVQEERGKFQSKILWGILAGIGTLLVALIGAIFTKVIGH